MKYSRILKSIVGLIGLAMMMIGCQNNEDYSENAIEEQDCIVLTLSDGEHELVRAVSDDNYQVPTNIEKAVTHFDVFVVDDTDKNIFHYERITAPVSGSKFSLSKPKSAFKENKYYSIYVLANCTEKSEQELQAVSTLDALKGISIVTSNVQITGLITSESGLVPQTFLMDGNTASLQLNDGDISTNKEVDITLRRAAAKITILLSCGQHAEFLPLTNDPATSGQVQRRVINFANKTALFQPDDEDAYENSPLYTNNNYSVIGVEQTETGGPGSTVSITLYSYSNNWSNKPALEAESHLIVRIPIRYKEDGDVSVQDVMDNYYKIPLSGNQGNDLMNHRLKRNHSYFTSIKVDALGAKNPEEPIELKPALFKVENWVSSNIDIGGAQEQPQYLTLNMDTLQMNNASTDETVLFASSSPITKIEIKRVYIIDKFGQEKDVKNHGVSVTRDEGLNGHVTINSMLPDNSLSVRYIELTIINANGQEENLVVEQYPLEYVVNTQGYYSYRDDFVSSQYKDPCTYINKGSGYNAASWSNGKWSVSSSESGFFRSKVAKNYQVSTGKSTISYYKYTNRGGSTPIIYLSSSSLNNARIYHVQITTTPKDVNYVLGLPRMNEKGYTDDGKDNAQIVSPSFMIASQLGAVQEVTSSEQAASHCEKYVEVANRGRKTDNKDVVAYHDWRLPTQAELAMIQKYQQEGKSDAIDEVLTGDYYWAANGIIRTKDGKHVDDIDWGYWPKPKSAPIRCIRDAYKDGERK